MVVDVRTNSIIITDTEAKLAEIRDLLALVDIPVRQVMIEARIVWLLNPMPPRTLVFSGVAAI